MSSPLGSQSLRALLRHASRLPDFRQLRGVEAGRIQIEDVIAAGRSDAARSARRRFAGDVRPYDAWLGGDLDWADLPVLDGSALPLLRHGRGRRVTTGGTTGAAKRATIAWSSHLREWAFVEYAWNIAGARLADRKLTLRGSTLGRNFKREILRYERGYEQLALSPFHLSTLQLRPLHGQIGAYGPTVVWGYPSAVYALSCAVLEQQPRWAKGIRAVIVISEPLYDWQASTIAAAFGALPLSMYGQTERVAFATQCELRQGFHFLSTYGDVERVDGRAVATGFTNPAMPLVRYDTGDEVCELGRCDCGRPFPATAHIAGRWDGASIPGRHGQPITMTSLNTHVRDMPATRFQIVSLRPGSARLVLFSDRESDALAYATWLARLFEDQSGGELRIVPAVRSLAEMPEYPRAKWRYLVNDAMGTGDA